MSEKKNNYGHESQKRDVLLKHVVEDMRELLGSASKKVIERAAEDDVSNGGKKDEDDDQNFIKKDDQENKQDKRQEVFHDIKNALDNALKNLSEVKKGVRPEGNQQRDLNRETGGVEAEEDKGISEEDAWDKRGEEIQQMIEDEQALNNASSKATRAKAFIHVDKQRKKKMEKEHKAAAGATAGYVAKLTQWRKNQQDDIDRGNGGGGRVM